MPFASALKDSFGGGQNAEPSPWFGYDVEGTPPISGLESAKRYYAGENLYRADNGAIFTLPPDKKALYDENGKPQIAPAGAPPNPAYRELKPIAVGGQLARGNNSDPYLLALQFEAMQSGGKHISAVSGRGINGVERDYGGYPQNSPLGDELLRGMPPGSKVMRVGNEFWAIPGNKTQEFQERVAATAQKAFGAKAPEAPDVVGEQWPSPNEGGKSWWDKTKDFVGDLWKTGTPIGVGITTGVLTGNPFAGAAAYQASKTAIDGFFGDDGNGKNNSAGNGGGGGAGGAGGPGSGGPGAGGQMLGQAWAQNQAILDGLQKQRDGLQERLAPFIDPVTLAKAERAVAARVADVPNISADTVRAQLASVAQEVEAERIQAVQAGLAPAIAAERAQAAFAAMAPSVASERVFAAQAAQAGDVRSRDAALERAERARDVVAFTIRGEQLDRRQEQQVRADQRGLTGQLIEQAAGRGPSVAEMILNRATENNIRAVMGQAASARGGEVAGAQRAAIYAIGELQAKAAQDAAIAKMQEQINAREQLNRVLGDTRTQDITLSREQAGLNQQANLANQAEINRASLANQENARSNAQFNAAQANAQAIANARNALDAALANQANLRANNQFNAAQANEVNVNNARNALNAALANQANIRETNTFNAGQANAMATANANRAFEAARANQENIRVTNTFNAGQANSIAMANASNRLEAARANQDAAIRVNTFNAGQANSVAAANADRALTAARYNQQTASDAALTNARLQNDTNQFNAGQVNNMAIKQGDIYMQAARDNAQAVLDARRLDDARLNAINSSINDASRTSVSAGDAALNADARARQAALGERSQSAAEDAARKKQLADMMALGAEIWAQSQKKTG